MITVLIAGIGGASLGVELAKCLRLAGGYRILGCDISPLAFGHYAGLCDRTAIVSRERYIDDVLAACRSEVVEVIVPGGDEPARLLASANDRIAEAGVKLAGNIPSVVDRLADKARCFEYLASLGVRIPRTVLLSEPTNIEQSPLPAIVKPSRNSGGSSFVFFARDRKEVELYAAYLLNNGAVPIAQEYLPHEAGEFTVGVLSDRKAAVETAIVLKRSFHVKLSVTARGPDFVISSGYSQGHIGSYPEIAATATAIAKAVESRGPLNIQGRVDGEGRFVPFEINPRFSSSTYLRALAGFNEVDHHIRALCGFSPGIPAPIRPGWYLRGLSEIFVADGEVRH
jgi:carbamoyl-phosphate synthase large subunit